MQLGYENVVEFIELIAVTMLCLGLTVSLARFIYGSLLRQGDNIFQRFRRELGRTLQTALEVLIAADIIETVVVERTLTSLGMLGALVLIRSFLSMALELEITGRWPWQEEQAANSESE
jgi:uncharacterized membrane protein